MNSNKKKLSPEQREELLKALKARFEKNMSRHKGLDWAKVQAKLEANTEKLWALHEMERTGAFSAPCRSRFRCHVDHCSALMSITIPPMPITAGF
jgi:hypothetical protein